MTYIDLDTIKKHLNIDDYFHDDDEYLKMLAEAVETRVGAHLDDKLDDIAADNGFKLPKPITHAMLLLIGSLYMSREATGFVQTYEIPLAYEYLLAPYKNYTTSQI